MRPRHLMLIVLMFILFTPITQSQADDWYVANSNSSNVNASIGGPACGFFTGTVPVGATPTGVAVNSDGTRVYVTNSGAGTVSVINTTSRAVIATVPVGGSPLDVAVSTTRA